MSRKMPTLPTVNSMPWNCGLTKPSLNGSVQNSGDHPSSPIVNRWSPLAHPTFYNHDTPVWSDEYRDSISTARVRLSPRKYDRPTIVCVGFKCFLFYLLPVHPAPSPVFYIVYRRPPSPQLNIRIQRSDCCYRKAHQLNNMCTRV